MSAVYLWHTVFTHLQNLSKTQILRDRLSNIIQNSKHKDRKVIESIFKTVLTESSSKYILGTLCGAPLDHFGQKFLQKRLFLFAIYKMLPH